jgi:hypothetical protein
LSVSLHLPTLDWPVHVSHMQEWGWVHHSYSEDNHWIILMTLQDLGHPT